MNFPVHQEWSYIGKKMYSTQIPILGLGLLSLRVEVALESLETDAF